MRIIINGIPPSYNKFIGNSHNFNEYRKYKEYWHWLIKEALSCAEYPKTPYRKASVTITYFFSDKKRRDPDNYSGKLLLDPLVRENIILDDSFDNISLTMKKGGIDKKNPRTEIDIFMIEEAV